MAFSVSTAYVTEGDPDLNLAVKLTPAPRAQVSILITTQGRGGATPSDWSGVPSSVTFNAGEDTKYFKVVVVDDDEPEDRETLRIGLGDLPTGFAAGTPDATLVVLIDNDEQDPASTQCPTDTGKRFVLERVSSISQSDEIDYWRVKLDPLRFYIIEVLGADSGVDVMGEDTHSGDLTLDDPELVAIWNGDRSRRVSRIGSGGRDGGYGRNSMIFPRGDTYDGWHQIEVRGKNGGTGTYQIKVRVSNICTIINGRAAYAFPGGPDGFSLDLPANVATHRGIYLRSGQGTSLGYLGDNSEWYWEREPDEDWMRVKMQSDHEYTFEVSNDTRYAAEYQARSLKIMGIHDDDGNLIPGTSSGSGGQVSVTFRPQTTGTYYLAVGSGSSDRTGFYVVRLTRSEIE